MKGNYKGFTSVIIPVRGIDVNAECNIRSLLNQDYKDYEVIYVVDDIKDPIVDVLKKYNIKVVVAESVCEECSGKIKAQLTGLKYAKGDIIVFGDSDTYYPRHWLKELVSPLSDYVATTVFSWPKPYKFSLKNLIRAGFWTFGFESQAVGGTFLWGGSMAFRRDFFSVDVIEDLKKQWCDDCTLSRIAKQRGKIGFVFKAMPLNVFDENDLIRWSKRQILTVRIYSNKGYKGFLIVSVFFALFLALLLILHNLVFISPFFMWISKNIIRGLNSGIKYSIIPSIMSVPAIFFTLFVAIISYKEKYIFWRGKVYKV
ncbi:glycosyl transferase family 2 [Stygiolobus caldivivus]|uniref:Glycosyl transferase family 2 n=1 Tax=Stygiolobus caldivivus TaxID=2824673 RepID=A0A8D5U4T7_9CREN|nr:glycosyl transferase family 2 [Stygiolobus caldivivus]